VEEYCLILMSLESERSFSGLLIDNLSRHKKIMWKEWKCNSKKLVTYLLIHSRRRMIFRF